MYQEQVGWGTWLTNTSTLLYHISLLSVGRLTIISMQTTQHIYLCCWIQECSDYWFFFVTYCVLWKCNVSKVFCTAICQWLYVTKCICGTICHKLYQISALPIVCHQMAGAGTRWLYVTKCIPSAAPLPLNPLTHTPPRPSSVPQSIKSKIFKPFEDFQRIQWLLLALISAPGQSAL